MHIALFIEDLQIVGDEYSVLFDGDLNHNIHILLLVHYFAINAMLIKDTSKLSQVLIYNESI